MTKSSLLPVRSVARVTIAMLTPFSVRAGRGDLFTDSVFITDANGLPAIPGSSIAGVLRHAVGRELGRDVAGEIFGAVTGRGRDEGWGARLAVSWAALHDQHDRPVEGLRHPLPDDPVLANARQGVIRDHVRLNHYGAVDDAGKFEDTMVAAGHRFTFELALAGAGTAEDMTAWTTLLTLLHRRQIRLGAGTRKGFGAFRVERVLARHFNLRKPKDYRDYCGLDVDLWDARPLEKWEPKQTLNDPCGDLTVMLKNFGPSAEDTWLFGGGTAATNEDMAPVAERCVTWKGESVTVDDQPVYYWAATGIKGALAHRVAWHHNRLAGNWADDRKEEDFGKVTGSANPAVRALFGRVHEKSNQGEAGEGEAGRVILDDLYLRGKVSALASHWHVSLDRFSGGARSGALFSELVLAGGVADYPITLTGLDGLDGSVAAALGHTLADIRRRRLTFGGGAGRGNGRFGCDAVCIGTERLTDADAIVAAVAAKAAAGAGR